MERITNPALLRGGTNHEIRVMIIRKTQLYILVVFVLLLSGRLSAIERRMAQTFVGQDLHVSGAEVLAERLSTGEHALVFREGFSMSIGANWFFSDKAVLWIEGVRFGVREVKVYLEGDISVEKGKSAGMVGLRESVVEEGQVMVVRFGVGGEVFVTAERRGKGDPRGLELYQKAIAAVTPSAAKFVVKAELPAKKEVEKPVEKEIAIEPERKVEEVIEEPVEVVVAEPEEEVRFMYPVNIAPAGEVMPEIVRTEEPDGTYIATVIGRLYVWQRQDERGRLLELQADNSVIFYSSGEAAEAIYMSGDVVMTEGQRTIRADEIYYDFLRERALVVNAVMRNFDTLRGIPIYVRAAKLRQVAENKFAAEKITLTSSEFYVPQICLNASNVIITDTTAVDAQTGQVSDSSFDAEMHDVELKLEDRTIFYWPYMRSNLQRPDVPLKSIHAGHDSTWGTSIETRWHLSRMLGLREPEGTESTLALDYYSKRGVGGGAEIEYAREDHFGRIGGYTIRDRGEDRLGRHSSRRNLKPPRELRGQFFWQHRHFLPYNWQVTTGVGYSSDEYFLEEYYRSEFNAGAERETYIHMKRLEDNWALSLMGKGRLNDFADEKEELPGVEFHLTGQSLFDDRFTFYSDTEVSRLRQRIGNGHSISINEDHFSFASQRAELDMPVRMDSFKVVPFVAGTFGYDDRSGFRRSLVDGSYTGRFGEDKVWIGEAGVRIGTQYWKIYPDIKSRLWDLNGLRHIIKPQLTAVYYEESDLVVNQRDTLNVAVSQRLQTKRGPADNQRTVDWLRLDMDVTLVEDSSHDAGTSGPDRFMWNKPFVPLRVLSSPEIFSGDLSGLQRFEIFGPRRNYFGADAVFRLSDTAAVLGDMDFDVQSGVVQQLNVGFSRMRWPNLSYYIGSRYLRRVEVLDEKGSNAFTFAATYMLDPRYTVVFSQQYDFDYGKNLRNDITLIRRYHRVYCALTFSADESLDRQSVVFSIWPQGVPELAIGPRRYMGLGGTAGY